MAKLSFAEVKHIHSTLFQTGGPRPTEAPGQTVEPAGVQPIKSLIQISRPENDLRVTKQPRKNVILVTPFMAEDPKLAAKMVRYAKRATRDSVMKQEAPIASNLFYYSVLNEKDPVERDIGLQAQLSWLRVADFIAVYVDFGITPAMKVAINNAILLVKKIEYRTIGAVA